MTCCAVQLAGIAPSTAAPSVNRGAMAAWARNWSTCHKWDWLNLRSLHCVPHVGRNPSADYGVAYIVERKNDCTDFVSDALHLGGGMPQTSDWYTKRHFFVWRDRSQTWTVADQFYRYWLATRGSETTLWWVGPAGDRTPADLGDVIIYNWEHGAGYSHLAVETGYGSATWKDVNGRSHSFYGDLVSQHSNPRRNSPWNLGYLRETDPTRRAAMRRDGWYIMHWTNGYNGY
ncbi:MAG: amidase domain-containing protein [Frankiaceae bacterium]